MKTHMPYRKYLLILGVGGAFFALAPLALAATAATTGTSFVSMSGFPAFQTATTGGLGAFINSLYKYLIGIAAILAVLEITWGGFLWMGSGASVTSKDAGRKKIMMALTGLLLVLSPVIIFSIINPSIFSLKLGTNSINVTQPTNKNTPTTATPTTGCTSAGGGTLLKKYVCAGTLANTAKYCTVPLTQATLTCSAKDSTGKCTSKTLYCSAPNTYTPSIYTPHLQTHAYLLKGDVVAQSILFPKSIVIYDNFVSSCNSDGGSVNADILIGGFATRLLKFKINKLSYLDFYDSDNHKMNVCTNKYPALTNIPARVKSTACFEVRLLCTPPTN